MGMDVQEAIRRSINTEKNAMYFYRKCAQHIRDTGARRVFELLEREEREHAGLFYRYYRHEDIPSLDAYLDSPPDNGSVCIATLEKLVRDDFCEKRALELAMEKELELQQSLLKTALAIEEPAVRSVFEQNAQETYNHYLLIEAEYVRMMRMVDESDMDTYVRE
ncbi:MAG TPA: ferritin family protein [Deltaproteobacteria bacterium]|nr:ferritin family protein [Deltaproteobacteria bacterium]HQB38502.1 ferritin family protein [Deltaproteobacteria bacterium]